MSRKALVSAESAVAAAPFREMMAVLQPDFVEAHATSSRKSLGRTAEALERLKLQAKNEGYQIGYDEGFEQGRLDAQIAAHEAMARSVNDFAEALDAKSDQVIFAIGQWYVEAEKNLAELAVTIAARILNQEIQLPHDTISALTREAVEEVTHAESIRIRINPFDVPHLEEQRGSLLSAARQLRHVEIVDDPNIRGGCVIESDGGVIDALIDTRLETTLREVREAA